MVRWVVRWVLRVFYFPLCFLRKCEDSEFVDWISPPNAELGLRGGIYRTCCPYCRAGYVRNTMIPDVRVPYTREWRDLEMRLDVELDEEIEKAIGKMDR